MMLAKQYDKKKPGHYYYRTDRLEKIDIKTNLKEQEKALKRAEEAKQEKRKLFFGQSKSVTNFSKQVTLDDPIELPALNSKHKIRRIASNLDDKDKELVLFR